MKLHQKLGKPIPSPDPVVVGGGTKTTTTTNSTGAKTNSSGTTASGNAAASGATGGASIDIKKEEIKEEVVELKEKEVEPVGQEYIEEIKNDEGNTTLQFVFSNK